ncbi:MAG: hypothetical protein AAGJ18_06295, partial [Bacteroidota bacterium]
MRKTILQEINQQITKGFEERQADKAKECCQSFLKAWKILQKNAPESVKDFTILVEKYNQGEADYDWGGWIWEVVEELGVAGKIYPEYMEHRIEFIKGFKARFPETEDTELMEYLQRNLIKTHFLMGNDRAGEKAVKDFYKKIDYSVWGYIEWADALLKREIEPSKAIYQRASAIYQKG